MKMIIFDHWFQSLFFNFNLQNPVKGILKPKIYLCEQTHVNLFT